MIEEKEEGVSSAGRRLEQMMDFRGYGFKELAKRSGIEIDILQDLVDGESREMIIDVWQKLHEIHIRIPTFMLVGEHKTKAQRIVESACQARWPLGTICSSKDRCYYSLCIYRPGDFDD